MDFLRLSTEQIEFLKYNWDAAREHRHAFMAGTPNFSSEFYAFTEGADYQTIEKRFKAMGIPPVMDSAGKLPIKAGRFCFYNIFDVQRALVK
jgi:hypothetical protein